MSRTNVEIYIPLFLMFLITACDHGLSPVEKEDPIMISGISGQINYINWPDTVINLKIIVFKEFPPQNILVEIQTGKAVAYPAEFSESLPRYVSESGYSIQLDPGEYGYVVVAEQYGGLFDWRAIGQYDTAPNDSLPTPITVLPDSFLADINIFVDFDNLPIQPF